jgi:hypothetical protein
MSSFQAFTTKSNAGHEHGFSWLPTCHIYNPVVLILSTPYIQAHTKQPSLTIVH